MAVWLSGIFHGFVRYSFLSMVSSVCLIWTILLFISLQMSSSVNPFVELRKALELIRKVLGCGVFESRLLTDLQLCERCLTFLLTYEICISNSYCESPSVKRVFIEDLFENPDLSDMESFYERLSPIQSKVDSASE